MVKKLFVILTVVGFSTERAHALGKVINGGSGGTSSSSSSSSSTSSSHSSSSSSSTSSSHSSSSSSSSSVSSSSSSSSVSSSSSSSVSSSSSSSSNASTPPLPTSSQQLKGLDVYHGDDITSWSSLVSGGMRFMAAKATEGYYYKDASYATNRKNAKNAGLIFGAYHFIDFAEDMVRQADYYADYVDANGGLDPTDFAMLDWETDSGDPYNSHDAANVKIFLEEIKRKLGRRCFVYVGYAMVNEVDNPSFLAEYPFFLADYNSHATVPKPWKVWNMWQTSGSATIKGLGNEGDSDLFNGSLDDLKALIKYTNL